MSILRTEMRNPASMHMDKMSTEEMARLVITANYDAVRAVENAAPEIAKAIDAIAEAFEGGHRLVYIGAGTSGRLGVLDASECPPTFGVAQDKVSGIIAGGKERMFSAAENAEDIYENGVKDVHEAGLEAGDVLVGISVAGGASYVVGALEEANRLGCVTVGLSSNPDTAVLRASDIPIFTDTGAEVLTGSTRLKAGTAQKIVLNALTTCAMTKVGNVYENMMVNLRPTNIKLKNRVVRITAAIIDCDEDTATKYLEENEWNIKKAAAAAKRGE